MKLITVRKNKGYHSVLMKECTEQAFLQAGQECDAIEGPSVIKPTKAAYAAYLEKESPFEKLKAARNVGDSFNILGLTFTRTAEYFEQGRNANLIELSYVDYSGNTTTLAVIIGYNDLLEEVFQTLTKGRLLYF